MQQICLYATKHSSCHCGAWRRAKCALRRWPHKFPAGQYRAFCSKVSPTHQVPGRRYEKGTSTGKERRGERRMEREGSGRGRGRKRRSRGERGGWKNRQRDGGKAVHSNLERRTYSTVCIGSMQVTRRQGPGGRSSTFVLWSSRQKPRRPMGPKSGGP